MIFFIIKSILMFGGKSTSKEMFERNWKVSLFWKKMDCGGKRYLNFRGTKTEKYNIISSYKILIILIS